MGAILTPAFDALQRAYDNRAEPEPDDALTLDEQADCAIEVIGRACRANDKRAAADLLRSAAAMLLAIADEVEA